MNITDVLEQLDIPTAPEGHHHARHGWIQIDCPYCSWGEERFRMGINERFLYANCWTCGAKNIKKVLSLTCGEKNKRQLFMLLEDLDESYVPRGEAPTKPGRLVMPSGVAPMTLEHKQYLETRGLSPKAITEVWDVSGIGPNGGNNLTNRLFIPIKRNNEIVSWTTRAIRPTGIRYINAKPEQEKVSRSELIYGEDLVDHTIVICEGPFDAWKVGPGAVALMGLSFTRKQVRRLTRWPRRIICFDNEVKAQERACALADSLVPFPGKTIIVNLDAKDPAEASLSEIKRLRRLIR